MNERCLEGYLILGSWKKGLLNFRKNGTLVFCIFRFSNDELFSLLFDGRNQRLFT